MKQQLQFSNKLIKPGEGMKPSDSPSGPFCPITPRKGDAALKGGAVTSAFMSAFL